MARSAQERRQALLAQKAYDEVVMLADEACRQARQDGDRDTFREW